MGPHALFGTGACRLPAARLRAREAPRAASARVGNRSSVRRGGVTQVVVEAARTAGRVAEPAARFEYDGQYFLSFTVSLPGTPQQARAK